MFIVSANYLDRQAKKRWLVREAQHSPKRAEPVLSVELENVQFVESGYFEHGFGCNVVAKAKTVVALKTSNRKRKNEVKLLFIVNYFMTQDRDYVDSCASLRLTPNGSIYATLRAEKPKSKKRRA